PQSRWKMLGRWYRVDLPRDNPLVTVFVLDSDKDFNGDTVWKAQLKWLETELAKPRQAKWLVSVCRQPLFINGEARGNRVPQRAWGPLFAKAKLDFYICGHDQDIQHLEIPPFKQSFLLVGGGGAHTRAMRVDKRGPFSKQTHGFAHLNFTDQQATVRLVG